MNEFKIIRFKRDPKTGDVSQRIIKTGLTEAEAKEHCSREDTHGENWFDGFDSKNIYANDYDDYADDWRRLAEQGHSPKIIESILVEEALKLGW